MHLRTLRMLSLILHFFLVVLLLISRATLNKAIAQEHKLQEPASLTASLDQKLQIETGHTSLPILVKLLSEQANISLMVNGESPNKFINFKSSGTVRGSLDMLCENFDYTWKPTKSGLIVMNKRFYHGDTLPQVHYMEIMQAAKDIINALSALPYDIHAEEFRLKGLMNPRWPDMLDNVASNLTPNQVSVLRSGAQLPITELSPPQRTQMEDIILTASLSSTHNQWAGLLDILKGIPKGSVRMDLYQEPQFFVYVLVDRDKVLFPSRLVIMSRPNITITNNSSPK